MGSDIMTRSKHDAEHFGTTGNEAALLLELVTYGAILISCVHSMAAEQKNPLAHLKMGDYYFYGLGTNVDESKAAAYYRAASDLRDAQATFNLGYMHQHGIGLPQDLHLAKRYRPPRVMRVWPM